MHHELFDNGGEELDVLSDSQQCGVECCQSRHRLELSMSRIATSGRARAEPEMRTQSLNFTQIAIGGLALFVGLLVYLVDRSPPQVYFLSKLGFSSSLSHLLPNLPGHAGKILPAFLHAFAFILITGGLLACGKRGALLVTLSWFLVDSLFEVGQRFGARVAEVIPGWFDRLWLLEATRSYFLVGTYDPMDMVAIATASVIAYIILLRTREGGKAS